MKPQDPNYQTRKSMEEESPLPPSQSEYETELENQEPDLEPSMLYSSPPSPGQSSQQQRIEPQPIPQQPMIQMGYNPTAIDEIEELVESVVEEKWRSFMESFGDIALWKERTRVDLASVKQELIRLQSRFENLQKAVLGRIQSYDHNITEVGSEIRALEQVLSRILSPLTANIKELGRITEQLKKK